MDIAARCRLLGELYLGEQRRWSAAACAVTLLPSVLQVAYCAERVPQARVCPLDALTLTHVTRTRAMPSVAEPEPRRTRAHRQAVSTSISHLHVADPPGRNRLSGHRHAFYIRIVRVENTARPRRRNNFKTPTIAR